MSRSIPFARSIAALGCGTFLAGAASAQSTLYDVPGNATNERLGKSIAVVGDLTSDGASEFLVGIPEDGNVLFAGEGAAALINGANGAVITTWDGDVNGDGFGTAVASGEDVDGDGINDFVVSAPFHTNVFQADGQVRVLSGADNSEIVEVYGDSSLQRIGRTLALVGDLNGDGRSEFMAGSHTALNDRGMVRVYTFNGSNATVLYEFQGSASGSRLGFSIDSMQDINADNVPDLLVGSAFDGYYIFSGADGSELRHTTSGSEPTLGTAVESIADITGDGVMDLAISAIQTSVFNPGPGRVYVKNGANDATLFTIDGANAGDEFGLQVADAGDWNGDGTTDLLISSDPSGSGAFVGIHSGTGGTLLATLTADNPNDKLGASIAGLGDLNGDGAVEVVAGAPDASAGFLKEGLVRVYSSPFAGCGQVTPYCNNAVANSTGVAADITPIGSTSVAAGQMILQATNLPPNGFGLFFYGTAQTSTMAGDGLICVAGSTVRLGVTQAQGGSVLKSLFSDPNSASISGGSTFNFQYWYRDITGGPAGFNFSRAVQIGFCD